MAGGDSGPLWLRPELLPSQAAPPGARFRSPETVIAAWQQRCLGGSESNMPLEPRFEAGISPSSLSQEVPEFFCACGRPALKLISRTERNPGRRFFCCYSGNDICKVWVWEDLIQQYVEKMVDYHNATTRDLVIEELVKAREELKARDKQINDAKWLNEGRIEVLARELKRTAEERDMAIEELAKAREELKAKTEEALAADLRGLKIHPTCPRPCQ
ncbi:hypothetical protein ACP70R_048558 [Stipagrostis hirtigluma subsp. patula]